jgi:hypothetical protein
LTSHAANELFCQERGWNAYATAHVAVGGLLNLENDKRASE